MKENKFLNFMEMRKNLGSRPGLKNITELMKRLKNPEKNLRVIQIAGTNGKGSTTQILSEILKQNGYIVGTFTSPELETPLDEIKFNDEIISEEDFNFFVQKIIPIADDMDKIGNFLTYFEILTAIAVLYLSDKNPDFAIFECGMGGKYDATNIFTDKKACVFTSISLDHIDFLGDTIAKIAKNKAGIIKQSEPVISYPSPEDAVNTIRQTAYNMHSEYFEVSKNDIEIKKTDSEGSVFSYDKYKDLKINLLGTHQVYNASLALKTMDVMEEHGYIKTDKSLTRKALLKIRHYGRLEKLADKNIILDGAHNSDGIDALVNFLSNMNYHKIIFLVGILKDKDFNYMAKRLCKFNARFVITEVPNPRKADIEVLKNTFSKYTDDIIAFKDYHDALKQALLMYDDDTPLVVCGSLYLMSKIRILLNL